MHEITILLDRIRHRWIAAVALRVASRVFVVAALALAAGALVDRAARPSEGALLAVWAVALGVIAAAGLSIAWPYRHRPDYHRVARFVEERCPELDDAIVTAVDVGQRPSASGADFGPFVIGAAVGRLRAIDPARIVDRQWRREGARDAVLAAAALVLAGILAAPAASRAIEAARLRYFPGTITIAVVPGDVRIPAGRPLRIQVTLKGPKGTLTRVAPRLSLEANGQARTLAMEPAPGGYQVNISAVDRSFVYRVRAGGAVSRDYSVRALFAPRVEHIDLRYEYPSFTGLAPRVENDGGDVYGPAGTRVVVQVHTDRPIASGRLAMSNGVPPLPLAPAGDRTFESTLTLKEEGAYRVALTDADGLSSSGTEYFIRLMDDRPPEVHVLRPVGDQQITPLEEVTIEARADDDYGIASFDMVYAVAGGREKVVPFTTTTGTGVSRVGSRLLAAEELRVKPGDVITYYARARDVARGKQSTLSRSEIFFLEVKPFNEEYIAAQSQAMAAATGTQLESLIAAQKEIISATWNLERRSAAGRSDADIKAIADAQLELKQRAEGAAGSLAPRRRRDDRVPQQFAQGAAASGEPVAEALAAMARAAAELQTRRTAEAIPHEMAALTALLKAQAEVRRRQVTQQASGASGGGNGRQGQDLSNLFDRELKRQQRTNYETRAQVEERPDQKNDNSALDRIRDLARRQEELSQRQRDLSQAALSAEELKRQLEKLTREQMELRQQTEDLARQLSPDSNASGQAKPGRPQQGGQPRGGEQQAGASSADAQGQQSSQAAAARSAAEQMRDAASQLRREDAASAAARGEDAARQLWSLEGRLQNGSPDARRRALGDLQLESQQIADAQRRIARDAVRLDRDGGGTADARRRLAGDKEQLADRVDAMKQAARQLAADPKAAASDRASLGEASREIEAQQLSERMRAGAREMRDPSRKPAGPGEQQLADALERVARSINGADAGGARGVATRLADQLDQVRAARDRLAQLEKQINDAQRARGRMSSGARGAQPGRTGPEGRKGQQGSQGSGEGTGDVARLQQEYMRELQRSRDLIDHLQSGRPDSARGMSTPEQHEWSRSAPGTEAWKQDYAGWQSLSTDITRALERYEASVADRLSKTLVTERLRGGGSDRVPDAYQQRIARYFESLARVNRQGR